MSHTIAAVSTGNMISAIGIIRLTGDDCAAVAGRVFTLNSGKKLSEAPDKKLVLGQLHDKLGRVIDSCCAIYSRGPRSYTGEDTVEFHCHGSPAILSAGLEALYIAGARPAKQGEFTKRAFLNGKLGLSEAEAVIDLIEADTVDAAANAAGQVGGQLQKQLEKIYDSLVNLCSHFHAVLDYPDEDIEDFGLNAYADQLRFHIIDLHSLLMSCDQGRILKNGISVAIVGKPNVGKSSLLNALAGYDRCIVTDIPGTTRDTIEETILLGSLKLRLIDTAGIRETSDTVEAIGVERSRKAVEKADLVLFVCDGSKPLDSQDRTILELCKDSTRIILMNKADLGCVLTDQDFPAGNRYPISAKNNEGLSELIERIHIYFPMNTPFDGSILTNTRQIDAIRRAHLALRSALDSLILGLTPDAVLTEVEDAMNAIGEVTGATVREDITARIFERFCVGK